MCISLNSEVGRELIKGVLRNTFDISKCDELLYQPLCKMREICILMCRCTNHRGT